MSRTIFRQDLAGYTALLTRFDLETLPNWHTSSIGRIHRIESDGRSVRETYPSSYWPGDTVGAHLEFALKYDGTNLGILSCLFDIIPQSQLLQYIRSKPTGKYARRIWFLFEFLMGNRLPIEDLKQGNYVNLLEPKDYYTTVPKPVRRQRINDNLLGDVRFCPIVRRTKTLQDYEEADLPHRCQKIMASYSPAVLRRALSYLFTRETKSSFGIEHMTPNPTRTERFVAALKSAQAEDFCDKAHLIELQNRIVDPRFGAKDYREEQSYVGEAVSYNREKIHYACPKPEDLPDLVAGLIAAHNRMEEGNVPAVIHAATVAYGFVFLHPFEDGNGRIHRFLIHNILARRGFTPRGLMFPVSAAMLKHPSEYDQSLEAFSTPLMMLIEYFIDQEGHMIVTNDTTKWYQFIDLTTQAEALFSFIEGTIQVELVEELAFLASFDRAKSAIQATVDMPDRLIDLLIRFCLQNKGHLSVQKRGKYFTQLTDDEVFLMEGAVQQAFGTNKRLD